MPNEKYQCKQLLFFQEKHQHVFVYEMLKITVVWMVISSQHHTECIVEMLGTVLFTYGNHFQMSPCSFQLTLRSVCLNSDVKLLQFNHVTCIVLQKKSDKKA